ncbi:hypothetical protein DRN74_06690 [Candidatus Micrarchaeota archaeon]|nr:MAG: hypothetical protein DRN74_06690 [Candidatus Micrarchaeota archaeon]
MSERDFQPLKVAIVGIGYCLTQGIGLPVWTWTGGAIHGRVSIRRGESAKQLPNDRDFFDAIRKLKRRDSAPKRYRWAVFQ